MNATNLGRWERVDLRTAWRSEAGDFTPWLASEENIALLAEAIGIDLEVEAKEQYVGPFRADILCKDTADDSWVLIENQRERTDHGHLGQLITYAAGLDALTVVWIAAKFTEEHRAALDWLNEVTGENVTVFGLEGELWRIGNSAIARKFNVVSSPNDWSKSVAQGRIDTRGSLTPAKQLQLEFWTSFCEYVQTHCASFNTKKPLPQTWMNIAIGRSGFTLNAIASLFDSEPESFDSHEIRAELSLHDSNAKEYFSKLIAEKTAIEQELGEPLTWYNPENKKCCRIFLTRAKVDLRNRSRRPEYHAWLTEKVDGLKRVFADRVRQLDVEDMLTEIVKCQRRGDGQPARIRVPFTRPHSPPLRSTQYPQLTNNN